MNLIQTLFTLRQSKSSRIRDLCICESMNSKAISSVVDVFLKKIRINTGNFFKIQRMEIVCIYDGNRMNLSLSIIIVYFHIIDIVSKCYGYTVNKSAP